MKVLFAVLALVSLPQTPNDLTIWHQALGRDCPSHHIDVWMPERNQDDLIDTFSQTLSPRVQGKLRRVVDVQKVCADAEGDGASSCEKNADIRALRRLHLLARFTKYACARVSCSEPAVCRSDPEG